MTIIRVYKEKDWPQVWKIIEPVFRAGATYAFSPEITDQEAKKVWIENPKATYVCIGKDRQIIGTYYFIKANQPTLGSHVCNCGYIVDKNSKGQGVASAMCGHSQEEAIKSGFKAMQYNLVVSTNKSAIRLWKKHDFKVVGVLPKAFNHKDLGLVDALVMYKHLEPLQSQPLGKMPRDQ
jgi:RimJ/RimL family protein N-acetyltransferase